MGIIAVSDLTASANIKISDASSMGQANLSKLRAEAEHFVEAFKGPVASAPVKSAALEAGFKNSSIPIAGGELAVKATAGAKFAIVEKCDSLFGAEDWDPIAVGEDECWLLFELDALLEAKVAVALPYGFGVAIGGSTNPRFGTYLRTATKPQAPTFEAALVATLESFRIVNSVDAVLNLPVDLICTNEIPGTVKVEGSWTLPIAMNATSLASAALPFKQSVSIAPSTKLEVAGEIALESEFGVRLRRLSADSLYLAVYKKKGTTFTASFDAKAGVTGGLGKTDLIAPLFRALDGGPKAPVGLEEHSEEINKVLKAGLDRSLSIALNATGSASRSDDVVFAYAVNVAQVNQATKDALAAALRGDWTALGRLPNAKKLRDVVRETMEKTFSLTVNLLGLYNYASMADFVADMQVLHNDADGSITITDRATAKRIAVSTAALEAEADKLRTALYEGFLSTAVYKALLSGMGANPAFEATQGFMDYHASLPYAPALKAVTAGEILGVMPHSVKAGLAATGKPVAHAVVKATRKYTNDEILRLFFVETAGFTPRAEGDLKKTGRRILAALLDPNDATDQTRIRALQNDQTWAGFDAQPANVPAPYYSDWYDITMWAAAIAKTGPALRDLIQIARRTPGDLAASPEFQTARKRVEGVLAEVAHDTHAAFEHAFSICVISALADEPARTGAGSTPQFEAVWDGRTIFSNVATEKPKATTA